ncbi:MAG: hypothetical protein J6T91_02155, partial [Alphaproteobacteria bacterium]|nr:hypothetical protein [Alphaproteobacteria bacterium]
MIKKIAEYLVGKGNSDVYSSDILSDVLKLDNKQTNLNHNHLEALQECLEQKEVKPSGNLKKTAADEL